MLTTCNISKGIGNPFKRDFSSESKTKWNRRRFHNGGLFRPYKRETLLIICRTNLVYTPKSSQILRKIYVWCLKICFFVWPTLGICEVQKKHQDMSLIPSKCYQNGPAVFDNHVFGGSRRDQRRPARQNNLCCQDHDVIPNICWHCFQWTARNE